MPRTTVVEQHYHTYQRGDRRTSEANGHTHAIRYTRTGIIKILRSEGHIHKAENKGKP